MDQIQIFDAVASDENGDVIGTFDGIVSLHGTIQPNTPPTGGPDQFTIAEGTPTFFDVKMNDDDFDGDIIEIVLVSDPVFGTAALQNDETILFTPADGFIGMDQFSYDLSDGVDTTTVWVVVNVEALTPNDTQSDHDFVNTWKSEPEAMPGPMEPSMMVEHMGSMALVPRNACTHIAMKNGDWFDPDTWFQGRIPGDDARVGIVNGVEVSYAGENVSRLFSIRGEGKLSFKTDAVSKIVCETAIFTHMGELEIGTVDNPITGSVDWVIANNGDIVLTYDPRLASRCLMSHGKVRMHGEEKLKWSQVSVDPMAGDTQVTLQQVPVNWRAGQSMIVTGTHKLGFKTYKRPSDNKTVTDNMGMDSTDELVTITGVDGNVVHFDPPLVYDHERVLNIDTGEPYPDFAAVGCLDDNIVIRSEIPSAPVWQRGHVMFMHSIDVDCRFVEFRDLGRTDKRKPSINIDVALADPNISVGPDFNRQGLYAYHFHKGGLGGMAKMFGCTINGSWGWGGVVHQSAAINDNCISWHVWGCHFVAEDGNELGCTSKSLICKSGGWKIGHTGLKGIGGAHRDIWRNGEACGMSGRTYRFMDNYVAGCGHGASWNVREATKDIESKHLDVPETAYGAEFRKQRKVNIQCVQNNVYWCVERMHIVIKRGSNQLQDHLSFFNNERGYRVSCAGDMTYTSKYLFKDCIATISDAPFTHRGGKLSGSYGIDFGTNSFALGAVDCTFQGFPKGGLYYGGRFTNPEMQPEDFQFYSIGNEFFECGPENHFNFQVEGMIQIADSWQKSPIVSLTWEEEPVINWGNSLNMQGVITDSLGPRKRIAAIDGDGSDGTWDMSFWDAIIPMMQEQGVVQDTNGDLFFDMKDPVADRADNDEQMLVHRIPLQGFTAQKMQDNNIQIINL